MENGNRCNSNLKHKNLNVIQRFFIDKLFYSSGGVLSKSRDIHSGSTVE